MAGLPFTSILLPHPPRALELLMCIFMLGGPFSFLSFSFFFFFSETVKKHLHYAIIYYYIPQGNCVFPFPTESEIYSLEKTKYKIFGQEDTNNC